MHGLLTYFRGMTETSCIATRHKFPNHDTTGSVGIPLANLDFKLVDDDGKDISGYDVRGELCVRGPTVIKGYYDNPEANARDWDEEGFFHTGDIGWIDPKTKLYYIVDRKKVCVVPSPPKTTLLAQVSNKFVPPRNSSKSAAFKSRRQSLKACYSLTRRLSTRLSLACLILFEREESCLGVTSFGELRMASRARRR
jgi:hypothetical protein